MRESTGWSFGRDARVGAATDAGAFLSYTECWGFGSLGFYYTFECEVQMRLSELFREAAVAQKTTA